MLTPLVCRQPRSVHRLARSRALPPLHPLLLTTLLFWGCSEEAARPGPSVRDSASITIVENTEPRWGEGEVWRVAPEPILDIGSLEGDPEYQLFEVVGVVRTAEGRIAVANAGSGEVRFFDGLGGFLGATGRKGSGPGEFDGLLSLKLTHGDSLLAYDWMNRRFSVLAPEGEYVRSFGLPVLSTAGGFPVVADPFQGADVLLATDMFVASGEPTMGAQRDSALYYIVNSEGEAIDTLGAFPGGESYRTMDGESVLAGGLVFGKFGYAATSADGFYFGSSEGYEIEYRTKTGKLTRIIRLDKPNLPVTQADIDRFVSDRLEDARDQRTRQVRQGLYRSMPFPDLMPAYAGLLVDAVGNLWVEEYRRPGDDQPRWRVFDPAGAYLGIVETPRRFSVYEIGTDQLLGRWRDDLDVDHVRVYELMKR